MKQRLPKDLKVSDRVQARGHAACGLDSCINQDGVCMRCLWTVKEACDLAFRLDHESILSRSGRAMAHDEEQDGKGKMGIRRSNKNRLTFSKTPIYGWWRPAWILSIIGGGTVTPRIHSQLTYLGVRARFKPPLRRAGGSLKSRGLSRCLT